jgi:hypothetical protein
MSDSTVGAVTAHKASCICCRTQIKHPGPITHNAASKCCCSAANSNSAQLNMRSICNSAKEQLQNANAHNGKECNLNRHSVVLCKAQLYSNAAPVTGCACGSYQKLNSLPWHGTMPPARTPGQRTYHTSA